MRHKLLRAVMLAGALFVAVGTLLNQRQRWQLPLAHHIPRASADTGVALAVISQRIQLAVSHATSAQIVEGAGVAWFFFVLALVVLARSGRAEMLANGSPVAPVRISPADRYESHQSDIATLADPTPAHCLPLRRSSAHRVYQEVYPQATRNLPQLIQSPHRALPSEHRLLLKPPDAATNDRSPETTAVSQFSGNPPIGSTAVQLPANDSSTKEKQLADVSHPIRPPGRTDVQQKNGHLLALTGGAPTGRQLLPYGLFLVAEDVGVGITSGSGEASRQIVDVIATQVAPLLASDAALGSDYLAALLKMAVLRASMALRYQGMRAAADLGVVVAGTMIIGQNVYVINVGHCRTYLYRPSAGLLQISTDHSVIASLVASGLLPPDALLRHPRRDQVYRCVGGDQAAEVDTFALCVQPGDQLVLCSPGLWQRLSAPEIEAIVGIDTDPRSTAERLFRAAARHGGKAARVRVVRPLSGWTSGSGIPAA